MQIFNDLSEVKHDDNSVITLGTFDGIHLGHKKIIDAVVNKSAEIGSRSFLITFYPHPRNVLTGSDPVKLLSTPLEKAEMLESLGIENLLVINFTEEFSRQSPDEFVDKYIVNGVGAQDVIIGYDHHFGKGRGGNIDFLIEKGKKSGFDVEVIPEYKTGEVVVSSSKIRNAISEGDITTANKYLGRYYSFRGKVVEGDKRGRELGFPTANLKIEDENKLLPAIGIYIVEIIINSDKKYGLLSVGKRPTFYDAGEIVPEVYVFDFDKDIYGMYVKVNLIEKIRGEEKFDSAEELIKQMNEDKQKGLEVLSKINN